MSLIEACQKADVEQIKHLIKQKFNINEIDDQGRTALHYCAEHDNIESAQILLKDNSILNLQDNEGCSVLHLACLNGNKLIVKYLCEQGADVNLVDNESHSPIHWITVCGHVDLFDIIMGYPTSIQTADIYGAYPIHYASHLCGDEHSNKGLEILKKLIEYNADINCLDEQKRTPFIWAANAGAIDALRILYKAGADPLHVDKDSLNALHCAAVHGHAACIRMLVELYGCPLESEDINGCTALFYAVTLHHSDACQMLLDLKANPNHQDNRGRTPSHCAAFKGNIDCLKRLVKSNADIWIKSKRGDYPIHEAVNAISFSKLHHQINELPQLRIGCFDVVRYISELYPKKINIRNGEQRTSLHLAASLGDIEMCQVLIQCGARINSFIQTSAGNYLTPYDLARIRHEDPCAEYLAYNHGGQRGNLLAQILARRIQNLFRRYKIRKNSIVSQRRKLFARMPHINISKPPPSPSVIKSIPIRTSTNQLLTQAKLCLHNKLIDDRLKTKSQTYLINGEDQAMAKQRHYTFPKSKTSINHRDNNEPEKIIVHTSNSIATSVKLYERRKLIAEELFKLKQARIHNHSIVINRPLYKIMIENAFNPANRQVGEIEKYLETLLKAYEVELEAIRKRTKSLPPRRTENNNSQRNTKNKNNTNGKDY